MVAHVLPSPVLLARTEFLRVMVYGRVARSLCWSRARRAPLSRKRSKMARREMSYT
jgi:hypothetical protein